MAFSQAVIDEVWERQNGLCYGCDRPLARLDWQAHHTRPVRKGGSNRASNCHLLCRECHFNRGHHGDWTKTNPWF